MPKQYTDEEQVEMILKALGPRVGKRAQVKRNLVYMKTALGATWVPVEEEERGLDKAGGEHFRQGASLCGTAFKEEVAAG